MSFESFHHGMRILLNIDADEFLKALGYGWPVSEDSHEWDTWISFRDDAHMWFIRAPDAQALAIWAIVEERMKQ